MTSLPHFYLDTQEIQSSFQFSPLVERLLMHLYTISDPKIFGSNTSLDHKKNLTFDTNELIFELTSKYQEATKLLDTIPNLEDSFKSREKRLNECKETLIQKQELLKRLKNVLQENSNQSEINGNMDFSE